jgi:Tfp pilus assembly protein PilF
VNRINGKIWWSVPAATAWLLLSSVFSPWCAAQAPTGGTSSTASFSQSIKNGFAKMGEPFSSKPKTEALATDDPTKLNSEGKPSVELYLSTAKIYEEANKIPEAEQQYQIALREKPNHLGAMLGYAHFLENQGRYDDAVSYYQRTLKAHPKEASVYNNLGLCHARKKKLKEATSSLQQAVQLDPGNPLYRNNITALLVEQNRLPEAFEHQRIVHGDAKAYYNLGYLLSKKGDIAAAEHHFKRALIIDPAMEPAQRWLSYLQHKPQPVTADRNFKVVQPTRPAHNYQAEDQMATRILPPPTQQSGTSTVPQQNPFYQQQQSVPEKTFQEQPVSIDPSLPKRLPPVTVRQPLDSTVSGDTSDSAPAAPLPPGMMVP